MAWTQADLDAHYRRMGLPTQADPVKAKASKLRNVKKEYNGIRFDSALECQAYQILKLWEAAGAIKDLRLQPSFTLQEGFTDTNGVRVKPVRYSADFRFYDKKLQSLRWVDVKGFETKEFLRSLKMMKDKFPDVHIELWHRNVIKEMARR